MRSQAGAWRSAFPCGGLGTSVTTTRAIARIVHHEIHERLESEEETSVLIPSDRYDTTSNVLRCTARNSLQFRAFRTTNVLFLCRARRFWTERRARDLSIRCSLLRRSCVSQPKVAALRGYLREIRFERDLPQRATPLTLFSKHCKTRTCRKLLVERPSRESACGFELLAITGSPHRHPRSSIHVAFGVFRANSVTCSMPME